MGYGPLQAVHQGRSRLPSQLMCDASDIQGTAALFTGLGWGVYGIGKITCQSLEVGKNAVDGGLDAGADVENTLAARRNRQYVSVNHIVKVNKIACLGAVAVDAHRLAAQKPFGEHGNHAGLTAMALRGPVHVGIAQRQEGQAVHQLKTAQIVFACQLGNAVGGHGSQRVVLVCRELFLLSVYGAAAGSENEAFNAVARAALQEIEKTDDVDRSVMGRIGGRFAHAHLCRMVGDNLGFFAFQHLVQSVIVPDIRLVKRNLSGHVGRAAGRQIVDDDRLMAKGNQPVGNCRSDKAGAAGHQNLH